MSRIISSQSSRDTVSSSKHVSKCVTFRIPTEKLHNLAKEAETKQISFNTLGNQIFKEYLEFHGIASQVKLFYLPKAFLMRLINGYTEEELTGLAREAAKNELVDICLFLKGRFSIASLADITETWLKVSRMPYRQEINGDNFRIIIQHDMGRKYSYLIKEICRYILEVAFEEKASYNLTDDTLIIEIDSFKR